MDAFHVGAPSIESIGPDEGHNCVPSMRSWNHLYSPEKVASTSPKSFFNIIYSCGAWATGPWFDADIGVLQQAEISNIYSNLNVAMKDKIGNSRKL
jgi:hypothetical protein